MSNTEAYYEACKIICEKIHKKLKEHIRNNIRVIVRVNNYDDTLNIQINESFKVRYEKFVDRCIKQDDSDKIVNDVLCQYKSEILNKYFYDPRKIQTL